MRPKDNKHSLKADGSSIMLLLFAASLSFLPFVGPPIYLAMLSTLLIVGSSLKWGLRGGIISSLWAAGLLIFGYLLRGGSITHFFAALFLNLLIGAISGIGTSIVRRHQLELKAKEQDQERLLDRIETQVWYLQDEETYGLVNQAHADFFGVTKEDLANKSLSIPRSTRQEVETCMAGNRQVMRQKQKVRSTEWVTNAKGEKRLLAITKTPILDANSEVTHVICSAEDITERQHAEDAKARISTEYETVFQSTQDAMFLVEVVDDSTFRFIRNNNSHVQTTGLQTEDLRGRTPQEVVGEEMGNAIAENYRRCVQERKPISYEEALDLPGGRRTWSTILTPVIENKEVSHIVGCSRDITQRAQIERQLKRGNERLSRAQSFANMGTWEFDMQTSTLHWSKECEEIFGLEPGTFEGTFEAFLQRVHPDDRTFVEQQNSPITDELTGVSLEYDHRIIRDDDQTRWIRESAGAVNEEDGRTSIIGMVMDITDRKIAENRLRESEEYNRSIVELIPDIIMQVNRGGQYLDILASSENELYLPKEDMLNRTIIAVLGEELGNRMMGCIEKALDTGKLQTIEYLLHAPEGDSWFEARIMPSGKDRVFALIRNITQRKRSEEKIRYLSFHDSLTGLYNRAFTEQELARLDVPRQMPLSIIIADVNGLKMINDGLGHTDGDALLQEAAVVLRAACRPEDIVARWGGDEFLVVLPQTAADEADEIARRIKRKCKAHSNSSILVSLALGYATKERPGKRLNNLVQEAEDRMYRDKRRERRSTYKTMLAALLKEREGRIHESEDDSARFSAMVREIKKRLDSEEPFAM